MDINFLKQNLTKEDISFLFDELSFCFQKRYQPRNFNELLDLSFRLGNKNKTSTRLDLILFFMPYSDYLEEQILIHAR
jgi:hypothetical protein